MLQPTTLSLSSLPSPARGGGSPMATTSDFAMALAELSVLPPTEAATAPLPGPATGATPIRQDLAATGNIVPIVPGALTKVIGQPLTVVAPAPALDCAVEPERPALPDGLLTVAAPVASPDYRPAETTLTAPAPDPLLPRAAVVAVVIREAEQATPVAPTRHSPTTTIDTAGDPIASPPMIVLPESPIDPSKLHKLTTTDKSSEDSSGPDDAIDDGKSAAIVMAPPPALANVTVPPLVPPTISAPPPQFVSVDQPAPRALATATTTAPAPPIIPDISSRAAPPEVPLPRANRSTDETEVPGDGAMSRPGADRPSAAMGAGERNVAPLAYADVSVPAPPTTTDQIIPYARMNDDTAAAPVARPMPTETVVRVSSSDRSPPLRQLTRGASTLTPVRGIASPILAAVPNATLTPPTVAAIALRPIPVPTVDAHADQPISAGSIATPTATDHLETKEPVPLSGETVRAMPIVARTIDTVTPEPHPALQAAAASPALVLPPVVEPLPPVAASPAPVTVQPAPIAAAPVAVTTGQPAASIQPVAVAPPADRPIVTPTSRARTTAVAAPIEKQPATTVETRRPVATPDMRVVALPPAPPPTPEVLPAAQMFAQAMFAAPRALAEAEDAQGDALPISLLTLTGHASGASSTPLAVQATSAAGDQATLDLARGEWMTTMIDRIETLRDESGAIGETRLKLAPDALGNVDVSVRRDDAGQYQVRISADTAPARTILAEAAPRLADMAEARGLKLSHAGVDGGAGGNTGFTDSNRRDAPPSAMPPRRPASAANDGDAGTEPTIHTTRIA